MTDSVLTVIMDGMLGAFGGYIMISLIIGLLLFGLVVLVARIEPIFALIVVLTPFVIVTLYNFIDIGYVREAFIIAVAILLATGIWKILNK